MVCPDNAAASAGMAAVVVFIAGLAGFKAAEALGAVSTNMIKKVVETMQFFSISFSVEIAWPGIVLKLGEWLTAFNFSRASSSGASIARMPLPAVSLDVPVAQYSALASAPTPSLAISD